MCINKWKPSKKNYCHKYLKVYIPMYVSVSSYELYKALFDMKLYINKQVPTSFEHSAIWFVILLNIGQIWLSVIKKIQ